MGQMLENTRLLERDRRPTVGCPVVVSLLPREWSCLYRRYFPQKCFSVPERNLVKSLSTDRLLTLDHAQSIPKYVSLLVSCSYEASRVRTPPHPNILPLRRSTGTFP